MSQRPVRNRLPTVPRGADPLTVIETLARRNLVEVSGTPSLRRLLWVENSFSFSLDTSPTISRQPPDTMMNSDDRLVGLPLPTQTQNAAEVTGAGHVAQETPDEENSDFEQPSEGDSDDTRGRAPASSGYEVVAPVPLSDEDMSEDEEDNYAVVAHASTTIFDHMDDQELAAAMSQIRNQCECSPCPLLPIFYRRSIFKSLQLMMFAPRPSRSPMVSILPEDIYSFSFTNFRYSRGYTRTVAVPNTTRYLIYRAAS
jgi:hypothetical protein